MQKVCAALIAVAAITVFAGSAFAKEVIIGNGCEFPLHFIGLSRGGDAQVENLLTEPLKPGDGIKVDLKEAKVDLTVQDNEGAQLEFSGLDLSNASSVVLKSDGSATIE